MGVFGVLAFLLGGGFLAAAFLRHKLVGTERFQRAMWLFFFALILHDLASAIPYMGLITVPIGYGLALWSFRDLCLAVAAHGDSSERGAGEF
jgi:hypothetical protein